RQYGCVIPDLITKKGLCDELLQIQNIDMWSRSFTMKNDEDMINKLGEEYMDHMDRGKRKNENIGGRSNVTPNNLLVSWMVTDLEDPKTHTVDGVWSREYMDHGFNKSMKELDRCYTMLQEPRSVIVGEALIHKNHVGSKHDGQIIRPTIGDFGGTCTSNQSPFNNERIEEYEEEKKSINNLVARKLVDFLKLPMEICPIEGFYVCRVPVTIEKSYKVEVLCIVDDIVSHPQNRTEAER
nr:hypothetical protein [Tanacetum cinerariifolium]